MKFSICLFICALSLFKEGKLRAQEPIKKEEVVFSVIEGEPSFSGGDDSLKSYVLSNIKYPKQAIEERVEGLVLVYFKVNSWGHVFGVKADKDNLLSIEAVRVVSAMPNWWPTKSVGMPSVFHYILPVQFKLEINDEL